MIKKMLIIIGIVIAVVLLTAGCIAYHYFYPNAGRIKSFIDENPDRSSILVQRNDETLISVNPNKMMPLASTVKIIVAIEYAEQAAAGKISPDRLVSLDELDRFYVPDTDGGAHSKWKKSVKDQINDNRIPVREVAKGMMGHSSNANTEWLMAELGLENINARLDNLDIKKHNEIFYIVSALFAGKHLFPELKGDSLKQALREVGKEEYTRATLVIHEKLKSDTTYKDDVGDLSLKIQQVWSDRLPASTVTEYVRLMDKMNSRQYFNPEVHNYLDEVMELVMKNPANQEWLKYAGMKGGSTAYVLTKAIYATDKEDNRTSLAYFFNELSIWESVRLEMSMNAFDLKVLKGKLFQ